MTGAPKLKLCQFCRSQSVLVWCSSGIDASPVQWVYCTKCQSRGPRVMMDRGESDESWMQRTIAAWNARHTPPEVLALVDALREILSAYEDASDADLWFACDKARPALTNWEAMANGN